LNFSEMGMGLGSKWTPEFGDIEEKKYVEQVVFMSTK